MEELKLTSKNVPKMPFGTMKIFGNQFLARWILRHVLQKVAHNNISANYYKISLRHITLLMLTS
jgi:hypothetical protein